MTLETAGFTTDPLSEAKGGNYQSALIMLEKAVDVLNGATDPPLIYLRECITRFIMGEDLDKAFNLQSPPRGRRPNREKQIRDANLSWEVKCLAKRDKIPLARAIEIIAEKRHVSTDLLNKALYTGKRKK